MSDLWLTRTSQNLISGPFSGDHVRNLILEGRLWLQDEVCPANGYWFYLHESEEVKRQLGIQVPHRRARHGAEFTQTDTQTVTETIDESAELTDPERVVPTSWAAQSRAPSAPQGTLAPRGPVAPPEAPPSPVIEDDQTDTTLVRTLEQGMDQGMGQLGAMPAAPVPAVAPDFQPPAVDRPQPPFSAATDRQFETRWFTRALTFLVVGLALAAAFVLISRSRG